MRIDRIYRILIYLNFQPFDTPISAETPKFLKKMTFYILTLFPEMFKGVLTSSILKRAQAKKLVKINLINIRDFASDKHKTVDDKPYGGGKGMILKVDVVVKALATIKPKPHVILLSPAGKKYDQKKTRALARKKSLALICGHYEGIDARVEEFASEVISIGDYILTGGEIATMAIVDSVARLIPGVIHPESLISESFSLPSDTFGTFNTFDTSLLEYPQYTKPENFRGLKVPSVLLSGNHQKIARWRHLQSIKITKKWQF